MENWIGVAVALGTGVICAVVGLPLMRGRVGPNASYGYRTKATLSNRELWYTVNSLTGKHLVATGAILIALSVIGLGALNDPDQQKVLVIATLAIMLLGIGYTALRGLQVIHQCTSEAGDRT